ncbi:uncharacterized protein LOC120103962 [Phoenix dactylifera]|uniref:Uncharacterized protein LOC120103962 n=1 Tax=Phoenix dactylifera TaxID=42345 RepID=A0A8B8ZVG2_PHODC|nr:uncharacterized protein LOC120103962 [Phoenix dactylifera]
MIELGFGSLLQEFCPILLNPRYLEHPSLGPSRFPQLFDAFVFLQRGFPATRSWVIAAAATRNAPSAAGSLVRVVWDGMTSVALRASVGPSPVGSGRGGARTWTALGLFWIPRKYVAGTRRGVDFLGDSLQSRCFLLRQLVNSE